VKEVQIDVEMELPADEIQAGDRDFARQAMERMRDHADAVAREQGCTLRTDRLPEFNVMRAMTPGRPLQAAEEVILIASRWWVDAPDSFDPARAAANSR
jgi:hypothetical protein